MSEELKVTIYEPLKDPRSVSSVIEPDFVPLIERGVYFNVDGSLCDEYEEYPEDLAADELIGFNLNSLPPPSVQPSLPPRQNQLQKHIDNLPIKRARFQKNKKLKLSRKRRLKQREFVAALATNPQFSNNQENRTNITNNETLQLQNGFQQPKKPIKPKANKKASDFYRKRKKKKAKPTANEAYSSQPPNPSRFPAFIRNPWMRKNTPQNAPKTTSTNNVDYIPIGNRNNQPRIHYNSNVPPLANTNRYFSLDNC